MISRRDVIKCFITAPREPSGGRREPRLLEYVARYLARAVNEIINSLLLLLSRFDASPHSERLFTGFRAEGKLEEDSSFIGAVDFILPPIEIIGPEFLAKMSKLNNF